MSIMPEKRGCKPGIRTESRTSVLSSGTPLKFFPVTEKWNTGSASWRNRGNQRTVHVS